MDRLITPQEPQTKETIKQCITLICILLIGLEYVSVSLYYYEICCPGKGIMALELKRSIYFSIPIFVILSIAAIIRLKKSQKIVLDKKHSKYALIIVDFIKTRWFWLLIIFTLVANPLFALMALLAELYLRPPFAMPSRGYYMSGLLISGEVLILLAITGIMFFPFPKLRDIYFGTKEKS